MRCDGSPDPTVPGEINTYINLRLEDKENNDIDIVLKQGQQDLAVSRTIYEDMILMCLTCFACDTKSQRMATKARNLITYELRHVISNNVAF